MTPWVIPELSVVPWGKPVTLPPCPTYSASHVLPITHDLKGSSPLPRAGEPVGLSERSGERQIRMGWG